LDPDGHPVYPVNGKGQSYGSSLGVALEDEPDLVGARATNGKDGYVVRVELYPAQPANPDEATALQSERDLEALDACLLAVGVEAAAADGGELKSAGAGDALQSLRAALAAGPDVGDVEDAFRTVVRLSGNEWPQDADSTAAEAAANCVDAADAVGTRVVPVYLSDGETVIGEFVLR
jgi:hypothetical protein